MFFFGVVYYDGVVLGNVVDVFVEDVGYVEYIDV